MGDVLNVVIGAEFSDILSTNSDTDESPYLYCSLHNEITLDRVSKLGFLTTGRDDID